MIAPQLKFELEDDVFWVTTVRLPSWRGFQARGGAYGAQSSTEPSDGQVQLVFAPEGRGTEPLKEEEISSVRWVIENEAAISKSLLDGLLKRYPELQQVYGYSGKEKAEYMPDVKTADDFKALIGLHSVHVHPLQKDGIPYVGFEFGCTWDEEHGLGAMMHGTRVVKIFGADTAILLWIADQDAEDNTNN